MSAVVRWSVAALLGVALAVALTLAALQLTDQHVGLAGEPPSVGRQLVPAETATTKARPATVTVGPAPPSVPAPGDDDGASEAGGGDD